MTQDHQVTRRKSNSLKGTVKDCSKDFLHTNWKHISRTKYIACFLFAFLTSTIYKVRFNLDQSENVAWRKPPAWTHLRPQTDDWEGCWNGPVKGSFSAVWPSTRVATPFETCLSMVRPSTASWISRSKGSLFAGRETQRPNTWTLGYRVLRSLIMCARRK